MSYILDALRRADADRDREKGKVPTLSTPTRPNFDGDDDEPFGRRPAWLWPAAALALVGAGAGLWFVSGGAGGEPERVELAAQSSKPNLTMAPPDLTMAQAVPQSGAGAAVVAAAGGAVAGAVGAAVNGAAPLAAAPTVTAGAAAAPEAVPSARPRSRQPFPLGPPAQVAPAQPAPAQPAAAQPMPEATPPRVANAVTRAPVPPRPQVVAAQPQVAAPRMAAVALPAAANSPAPSEFANRAPNQAPNQATTAERVPRQAELPEALRREMPPIAIGGSVHSANPAGRMVIINGQVRREGDLAGPELTLERISQKAATFSFKGQRFQVPL